MYLLITLNVTFICIAHIEEFQSLSVTATCFPMASVNKITQECISTLENLPNNELVVILLTQLTGNNIEHARDIFEIIKSYLAKGDLSVDAQVHVDMKLPVLYLIDCIIKHVGEPYITLFTQDIILLVHGIFQQVDLLTRIKIWKLRQTWFGIIPVNKLYALDNTIADLDPAWRSIAPPPPPPINSDLNSKTTAQLHNEEVTPTVPLTLSPNRVLINPEINETQQKVLDKQKQLLELQQYKLMLEVKQTQVELPEKCQNENLLQSVGAATSIPDINQAVIIKNAELENSLSITEISEVCLLDHQQQRNPLDFDRQINKTASSSFDSDSSKTDFCRKNQSCQVMSASEEPTNLNNVSNAKEGQGNDGPCVMITGLEPSTSVTVMKRPSSVDIESSVTKKKKSVISESSIREKTIRPKEPSKSLAPPPSVISKQVNRSNSSIPITKDRAIITVPTNTFKASTSKLIDEQNSQTVCNNRFTTNGKCSRKTQAVDNKTSSAFPQTNHFGRSYNKCSSIMTYEYSRKNKWYRWTNPPSPYVWRPAKPDFHKLHDEPKGTPHYNKSVRLPTVVKNRTKVTYNNPPQFLKTNYRSEDLFNGSGAQSKKPLQEILVGGEDTQNKSQSNDVTNGPAIGYQETNRHFALNEFIQKMLDESSIDSSIQPEVMALFENSKPNFSCPGSLQIHQPSVIEALYGGIQCKSCGIRFKQSNKYEQHMNWHLRQHKNKKGGSNNSRYPLENLKQEKNQVEKQNQDEDTEKVEILTFESSKLQNRHCEVCQEEFKQHFSEEANEWHLCSAIHVDSKIYHILCYDDYQAKFFDETSSTAANDNLIPKLSIKEEPIENAFIEVPSILVKIENNVFETVPLVCNETGDSMYTEVVHSIDGNIKFNSKPQISNCKIKINLTKPVIVPTKIEDRASEESKPDFSDLCKPWLPSEELLPHTVKPPLKDLELKNQPLVEKGHELVSLCSVM